MRARLAGALLLALCLLVSSTFAAHALWSTQPAASVVVTVPTLQPPTNLTCTGVGNARILSWTAPTSAPAPTGYEVLRNGTVRSTVGATTTNTLVNGNCDGHSVRSLYNPGGWTSVEAS